MWRPCVYSLSYGLSETNESPLPLPKDEDIQECFLVGKNAHLNLCLAFLLVWKQNLWIEFNDSCAFGDLTLS